MAAKSPEKITGGRHGRFSAKSLQTPRKAILEVNSLLALSTLRDSAFVRTE